MRLHLILLPFFLMSCASTDSKFIMKNEKECRCTFDSSGYTYDVECCEDGMWYKYMPKEAVKK